MLYFLDTSDVTLIKRLSQTGLVDGITTNPSTLSAQGKTPKQTILEICSIMGDRDVSVEVTELEPSAMYEQAKKIAALASNVVVKIPCHTDYYPLIQKLIANGIRINVTLVFSLIQAFSMAKLGVTYVSPFMGRLDDIGTDSATLINDIVTSFNNYGIAETRVLAASIRSVQQFQQVITLGADIATLPPAIFELALKHPLTDAGIQKFDADWKKLNIDVFP